MRAQKNKFMLSLRQNLLERMDKDAEERGLTLQEFIRAVVIPTYYSLKIEVTLPRQETKTNTVEPFIRRRSDF